MSDKSQERQLWHLFYANIQQALLPFGQDGGSRRFPYWIHDEWIGTPQQKIYVNELSLLRPNVIDVLQRLVIHYPGWEIMVVVCVFGGGEEWPDMGLTIRPHEIIDGLQREYFPPEHRGYFYPGSRVGTDRD